MKTCVVPNCKTGYKSCKEKKSVFRVPSDAAMRKKWELAIPGIANFKPMFHVCERHFERKFIIRKFEKYIGDRKITEYVYKNPQLDPLAVPTIFIEESFKSSVINPRTVHECENYGTELIIDNPSCEQVNVKIESVENSVVELSNIEDVENKSENLEELENVLVLDADCREVTLKNHLMDQCESVNISFEPEMIFVKEEISDNSETNGDLTETINVSSQCSAQKKIPQNC